MVAACAYVPERNVGSFKEAAVKGQAEQLLPRLGDAVCAAEVTLSNF